MKILLRAHTGGAFLNQNGQWLTSRSAAKEFSSGSDAIDYARKLPLDADLYFAFMNEANNFQIGHEHKVEACHRCC